MQFIYFAVPKSVAHKNMSVEGEKAVEMDDDLKASDVYMYVVILLISF